MISKRVQLKERVYLLQFKQTSQLLKHQIKVYKHCQGHITEALTAGSQIFISFVISSRSHVKKFVASHQLPFYKTFDLTQNINEAHYASNMRDQFRKVYTSEIIKDVRARGISNMDKIGLCGWRTKVDKSTGKQRTGGAIKKTDPEHVSLALSISCGKSSTKTNG
ncbi:MAG: hypothetical protein EZS28_035260 [Streblomastix strix]|uniref:Uncharacterized protein n=1 Tax=Streblomastix strix TaxID=222440 RepID=A0A5J4UG77_9EUKA|nr:MAG: hypothetical protein EZS28_035260 [Streblomastix strix]